MQKSMTKRRGFRAWFYFRQGWSTYFAFLFAGINTLTVTYYLAIEKYPTLQQIFPTFGQYVVIVAAIGIPILVAVGYAHYKKTPSYRAEADVWVESNPYQARVLVNSELLLSLTLKLTEVIGKISKNEKISDEDFEQISKIHDEASHLAKTRTFANKKDVEYFKKLDQT